MEKRGLKNFAERHMNKSLCHLMQIWERHAESFVVSLL